MDAPGVRELVVLAQGALFVRPVRRPLDGADHQVLRRVLGGDELDRLGAVAERLERARAEESVIRSAMRARRIPCSTTGPQTPGPRSTQRVVDLHEALVLAARGEHDRLGAEPDAGGDRLVGRRVAGVQADEKVDRLLARACVVQDRRCFEPRASYPSSPAIARTRSTTSGLESMPTSSTSRPRLRVQVEREAHVRLAAARVDDAQRPGARPDRQRAEQLDVVLDLTLLVRRRARRLEEPRDLGIPRIQRVVRTAVVGREAADPRRGGACRGDQPPALLGLAGVPVAVDADDVDPEQRLVEQDAELARPVRERDVAGLLTLAYGLDQLDRRAALPARPGMRSAGPSRPAEDGLRPALDQLGLGELLVQRHKFRRERGHVSMIANVISSLHVATGAAAGALLRSRSAAFVVGPLLHVVGDRMPHHDIGWRKFEVWTCIGGIVALGIARGPLDPATVGGFASRTPSTLIRRPGGSSSRPRHARLAPAGHRVRVEVLAAGPILGGLVAAGVARRSAAASGAALPASGSAPAGRGRTRVAGEGTPCRGSATRSFLVPDHLADILPPLVALTVAAEAAPTVASGPSS